MPAQFQPLTITDVRRETDEAVSVAFAVPDGLRETFRFTAGQYLTLRAEVDGEELRRNYSVCVSPHDGELRVAIKAIQGGRFSNWANDNLKPGDTLEVLPPSGAFTLGFDPAHAARYLGVAGGSGITPVISLLKTGLREEPNSRFTLIYGNRTTDATIFLEELQRLKNRYMDRLTLVNVLSDDLDDIELFNGMLTEEKVGELLDTLGDLDDLRAAFICGPGPVMDAAEKVLKERGVPDDRIMLERFGTAPPSAQAQEALLKQSEQASGYAMKVTLDGRTRRIAFDKDAGNILETARRAGLPAPYACKAGVCATCRAKVSGGKVAMAARYGLSDKDIEDGYILTCQAIPEEDGLVVNFDQ